MAASMAAIADSHTPLTEPEKKSMGLGKSVNGRNIWRIDGARIGSDKAVAQVYSQLGESSGGTCFTIIEILSGHINDSVVKWRERLPYDYWQIVWLADQRKGRPCNEMIDNQPINLRTPIEENTVIRLYEQRASFAPEAVPFILTDSEQTLSDEVGHFPNPTDYLNSISPAFRNNPSLTDVSIEMFHARQNAGAYRLTLKFAQCHGLSLIVQTRDDSRFEVIDAHLIVC